MINLTNNNYEVVRAAWTGMDQTYGIKDGKGGYTTYPKEGEALKGINSSGGTAVQPWQTPAGFVITKVIEDPNLGGRFVIYRNEASNTTMLVSMGTNGNDDGKGWYTNFLDTGRSQWKQERVRGAVFDALNANMNASSKLILAGDSKGGALSQFVLYDLVKWRDDKETFTNQGLLNLASLKNDNIAMSLRVAPAITEIIRKQDDPTWNPNGEQYKGIAVHSAAAVSADGKYVEKVSEAGGDSHLGANGMIHLFRVNVPSDVGVFGVYQYLHRLVQSGYDWATQNNSDFSKMTLTPKGYIKLGDAQSYGSFFSQIGAGSSVSNLEGGMRVLANFICATATLPISSLTSINEPSTSTPLNNLLGILSAGLEKLGVQLFGKPVFEVLAVACGASVVVSNVLGAFN
jgi:hypothetical protein